MKAGLATSLSIAGVLATGGAALVLNSSILDTASTAKGSPALATVVGLTDQTGAATNDNTGAQGSVTASGLADVVSGVEAPLSVDSPSASLVPAGNSSAASKPVAADGAVPAEGSQSVQQKQATVAVDEPTTTVVNPTTTAAPTAPTTSLPVAVDKQFRIDGIATITLTATNGKLAVKSIDIVAGSGYSVGKQYSHDGDDVRIAFTSASRTIEFSARVMNGQIVAAIGNPGNGNLMPPRPGEADRDRNGRHDNDGDRDGEHDGHKDSEREGDDD